MGHFCPPGYGSVFKLWIPLRIQWSDWIRIQYGSGSETLVLRLLPLTSQHLNFQFSNYFNFQNFVRSRRDSKEKLPGRVPTAINDTWTLPTYSISTEIKMGTYHLCLEIVWMQEKFIKIRLLCSIRDVQFLVRQGMQYSGAVFISFGSGWSHKSKLRLRLLHNNLAALDFFYHR